MDIGRNTPPLTIFNAWLAEAQQNKAIREATAMTLATVDPQGNVHARVVLCKNWSEHGFVFYTNYQSQKGLDLEKNPHAAAVFYWDAMFRQIKISGAVSKTSRETSKKYWSSRERASQLSQYISRQSEEVPSRQEMERMCAEAEVKFAGLAIPCPENWGGYLLAPERIEFWIGQPGRLHDRFEYRKSQNHWTFCRLYP